MSTLLVLVRQFEASADDTRIVETKFLRDPLCLLDGLP